MVEGTKASATVTISPGSWKARGVDCSSSWCEATALNAPKAAMIPTTANAWLAAARTTTPSTVPHREAAQDPGRVASAGVNQVLGGGPPTPSLWLVSAVSTTRRAANTTPMPISTGKARARELSRRWVLTTSRATVITNAT